MGEISRKLYIVKLKNKIKFKKKCQLALKKKKRVNEPSSKSIPERA